jgi:osmotically-inducible protein OsmY
MVMAEGEARGSDERAQAEARDRLRAAGIGEEAPIQVHIVGGEATLTGTVDSADARARAEAAVQAVSGVTFVINNLRVAQEGTTGATG